MNEIGILKKNKEIVSNVNKEDLKKKIADMKNENEVMKKQLNDLENWKK